MPRVTAITQVLVSRKLEHEIRRSAIVTIFTKVCVIYIPCGNAHLDLGRLNLSHPALLSTFRLTANRIKNTSKTLRNENI